MSLLRLLKQPVYAFLSTGVAILLFDIGLYFLISLPGSVDHMCVPYANFTIGNILFNIVMSVMLSISFIGVIDLIRNNMATSALGGGTTTGIAGLLAAITMFCPICSLPAISLFGLSAMLQFVNDHSIWFQLLSLLLVIYTYWMLNARVESHGACAYKPKG